MSKPKPLSELNISGIKGIFFDIDDTFSTDGKITSETYSSLWKLHEAGFMTAAVTGRPAGWCDHIARMWPATSVIGENGAFYFMMKDGKLQKNYLASKEEMEGNKKKLEEIRKEVFKKHPGAALASDQSYREFDMAVDFCEDVKRLPDEEVEDIRSIMEKHGTTAKISSIHVNCWFGGFNKIDGVKFFVKNELGLDLDKGSSQFIFCGDAPNDATMFTYFDNSVGVANLLDFEGRFNEWPKYLTKSRSGVGFTELANHLLGN